MTLKKYTTALNIISALILLSRGIEGCNEPAVSMCILSFGMPSVNGARICLPEAFERCLTGSGYDQCTSPILTAGVEGVRQIQASPNCAKGGLPDDECLEGALSCTIDLVQSFGGFDNEAESVIRGQICMCEDINSWINNILQKHQECVNKLGYSDCPVDVKNQYEQLMNAQRSVLESTQDYVCNMIKNYVDGTCECATKVDQCVLAHIGSVFWQKLETQYIDSSNYPGCLTLGSEEQFKEAAKCVLSLPEKCGLQNFTPSRGRGTSSRGQHERPKIIPGVDILNLRYSCAAGCANLEVTTSKHIHCLVSVGAQSLAAHEIQALQSQEKDDYCAKVKLAANCAAEELSACPTLMFSMSRAAEEHKDGNSFDMEGLPAAVEMYPLCDIDILEYSNILPDFNDSKQPRNVTRIRPVI